MNTTTPFPIRRPVAAVMPPSSRYTANDWDEVRKAFSSSILVDTPLSSLAQNLEGLDWPLRGPDETPATYLELSFNEVRERLALQGQPPSIGNHLIDILKETLAFDDPFGEMVTQSETLTPGENPLVKNLVKLGIPADFPVALTALSPETLLFCRLENISTLGEFAFTAQRMAGSVIVGGDFRALLNALSHVDERTLARFLPFRPGSKGVHYVEGMGQAVCAQPVSIQAALAHRLGQPLPEAAEQLAREVTRDQLLKAKNTLRLQATALRGFCGHEHEELQKQIAAGVNPRRLVTVLGDPSLEAVVADLITPTRPTGFGARMMRWFGR